MSLVQAFLLATAFAYLACLIYTLMGKSPLVGWDEVQVFFYLLAFAVFAIVSIYPFVTWLNFFLGIFYAFGAVGSFIGYPQIWAAYWREYPEQGSDAGQIGMALWDLALSVCFFYLFLR